MLCSMCLLKRSRVPTWIPAMFVVCKRVNFLLFERGKGIFYYALFSFLLCDSDHGIILATPMLPSELVTLGLNRT